MGCHSYTDEGYTLKDDTDRKDVYNKTKLVFHLFQYLTSIIHPTAYDSESFASIFSDENYLGPQLSNEISSLYDVSHLEKNLAFEISLVYYLFLRTRQVFSYDDKSKPVYFYQILNKILEADNDISTFFNKNLGNIKKYYKEVYHTMEAMLKESKNN